MEAAPYLCTPSRLRALAGETAGAPRERLVEAADALRSVIDRLLAVSSTSELELVVERLHVESGGAIARFLETIGQLLHEVAAELADDKRDEILDLHRTRIAGVIDPVDPVAAEELRDCLDFVDVHVDGLVGAAADAAERGAQLQPPTLSELDLTDGRVIHALRYQFLVIAVLELLEDAQDGLPPLVPTMCDLAHESMRITASTLIDVGVPIEPPPLRVSEEIAAVRWQERCLPDLYARATRLARDTGNTVGNAVNAALQSASIRVATARIRKITEEMDALASDDEIDRPADLKETVPISSLRGLLKPKVRGVTIDDMNAAIARGAAGRARR